MGDNNLNWQQAVTTGAGAAIPAILGLAFGRSQDRRQIRQGWKLQEQWLQGEKHLMDLRAQKELEMWMKTGPVGQIEQYKKAGLNPALMYGMGGGGGATTGGGGGAPSGQAPSGGGDITGMMGMGLQTMAQVKLMQAQKENIEADTANKKEDTKVKTATEQGMGQENAIRALLIGNTPEGYNLDTGEKNNATESQAFQKEAQEYRQRAADIKVRLEQNEREKLMNSKVMEEIGQRISLMATQGLKEGEIYRNLQKEGKLLDAEIEWNALDIEHDNVGKFISNAIRMALKPR